MRSTPASDGHISGVKKVCSKKRRNNLLPFCSPSRQPSDSHLDAPRLVAFNVICAKAKTMMAINIACVIATPIAAPVVKFRITPKTKATNTTRFGNHNRNRSVSARSVRDSTLCETKRNASLSFPHCSALWRISLFNTVANPPLRNAPATGLPLLNAVAKASSAGSAFDLSAFSRLVLGRGDPDID